MESMTGFGSSERGNFRVEARSLNHRFLEINFKMPYLLYPSEMKMRETVKSRFSRGRIDISISFIQQPDNLQLNKGLLFNILNELKLLVRETGSESISALPLFFNLKDMMVEIPYNYDEKELLACLDEALQSLKFMRKQEGESLKTELQERIEKIGSINAKIKNYYPAQLQEAEARWKERIKKILDELDAPGCNSKEGLISALALMLEKMDITEEVVRIDSHIEQFRRGLDSDTPQGKRLDFLIQEMLREFNTIGSKASSAEIKGLVVEAKTELEKLREQVQNIE